MKKRLLGTLVLVVILAVPAVSQDVWNVVSGRVWGMAETSLIDTTNYWTQMSSRWRVRRDLESRLDAALLEMRGYNPQVFDEILGRYGLWFDMGTGTE